MWKRSRRCSSRARPGIAAALLGAALLAPGMTAGAAGTVTAPADVSSLAAGILADERYQKELPDGKAAFQLPWLQTSPFARAVIIAGLIVLAGILIAWIINRLIRQDERPGEGEAAAGGGGRRASRGGDGPRLAAEGRYDEAVHALLLSALGHLLIEAGQEPRPSATMREILRELPLQGDRRRALGSLVRHVEVTLFGGRAAGPEDYSRCLESFQLLVPSGAA